MRFIFCVELPWVCFVGNPEAHMKSSYSGSGNLNAGKSEQVSGDQPRPQLPHMFRWLHSQLQDPNPAPSPALWQLWLEDQWMRQLLQSAYWSMFDQDTEPRVASDASECEFVWKWYRKKVLWMYVNEHCSKKWFEHTVRVRVRIIYQSVYGIIKLFMLILQAYMRFCKMQQTRKRKMHR